MSSHTAAEEQHRLRLLRGDNYQYQPQWVRLTEDKKQALDAIAADKPVHVRTTSSSSVKSDTSDKSASDHIELAGFTGVRLL